MAIVEQLDCSFFDGAFQVFLRIEDTNLRVQGLRIINSDRHEAFIRVEKKGGGDLREIDVSKNVTRVIPVNSSGYDVFDQGDGTYSISQGNFDMQFSNLGIMAAQFFTLLYLILMLTLMVMEL